MTRTVLTYRDYEALPSDGRRYEIHDGELSVTPAPTPQHQIVSINIVRVLLRHIPAKSGRRAALRTSRCHPGGHHNRPA